MIRRILLSLLCAVGMAAEIRTYTVRLDAQPDGTARAAASLLLTQCTPGRILLPVGFKGLEGVTMDQAPPGVTLELSGSNGLSVVRVSLPENIASEVALDFSFVVARPFQEAPSVPGEKSNLPMGSRLFAHTFVNTQEAPIGSYRLEVRFPEGQRAHAIRDQLPKLRKGEVGPRARLDRFDGREGVVLQVDRLKQGDATSVQLELVPRGRSWAWLIVGTALSILYLVYFRDLVAPKRA